MSMDTINISYGRSHLPVDLPKEAKPTLIRKRPLTKLADPGAAIAEALAKPIAAAPLSELAKAPAS